jgi:hypothetical protein
MSPYAIGLAALFVSLAAVVGVAVWALVRGLSLRRAIKRVTSKPAFQAVAALPVQFERIGAGVRELQSTGARFSMLTARLQDASVSGVRIAADIRLVADATEDLLETFIPSMRGSM